MVGLVARRSRSQLSAAVAMHGRGGRSSLLRLTPAQVEEGQRSRWPTLSKLFRTPSRTPAFLCTDFAPSQWFQP
ncbi:hypothetical protein C1702_10980 [Caldimonas thermodepolymerans]|jgi:hypothetical protein|uniref:Uncharacterized protein n=2 Tax=Caldimonas thermodepolymerans TaxID=215580 RepID=A0A2S5T481_9BURK|nr:hypothetical protein C1702_10980 [Caldimonas thermodepolymerans]RDI01606.1 hypothetical protein DES46_103169 [Caldimonas thermodepolymerans]TCP04946.1 hypothetical protein EV676_10932 [Caldimonas thermodepolymerans]